MATNVGRESSFVDKGHNSLIEALYLQKEYSAFCDVIMKVCGQEIFAHSNVLAAASPYFNQFLRQDLPRQFSQRAPQVIEIQIDGSEPTLLYEEAVAAVIDFIYTGQMTVKEKNVSQISEIARIMQMDNIVQFCEEFFTGKVTEFETEVATSRSSAATTSVGPQLPIETCEMGVNTSRSELILVNQDVMLGKLKKKGLVSVATQVMPRLLGLDTPKEKTKDVGTSTEGLLYNKPFYTAISNSTTKKTICQGDDRADNQRETPFLNPVDVFTSDDMSKETIQNSEKTNLQYLDKLIRDDLDKVIGSTLSNENITHFENTVNDKCKELINETEQEKSDVIANETKDDEDNKTDMYADFEGPKKTVVVGRSGRKITKITQSFISSKKRKSTSEKACGNKRVKSEIINKKDSSIKEKELDSKDGLSNKEPRNVFQQDSETVVPEAECNNVNEIPISGQISEEQNSVMPKEKKKHSLSFEKNKLNTTKIKLEVESSNSLKYNCDMCNFSTNKVRDISDHKKMHIIDKNQCYYCTQEFEDKDTLKSHMTQHKGPNPFVCSFCNSHFKSRTQLILHLPKHSADRPFICEVCSMGFKWKHALNNHMVTHSNKKEHLCDFCGYATAHKSQLKAHRLIHTGETFRCSFAGCSFQATKRQNLKYHIVTHTRERPHQCEFCGMNFSLVKNMRRHMLLHSADKPYRCDQCDFGTTRFDKLKDHKLKLHGVGTAPERRISVAEMVAQNTLPVIIEPTSDKDTFKTEEQPDHVAEPSSVDENQKHIIIYKDNDSQGMETVIISRQQDTTEGDMETIQIPTEISESLAIHNEAQVVGIESAAVNLAAGDVVANQGDPTQFGTVQYAEVLMSPEQITDLVGHVTAYVAQ